MNLQLTASDIQSLDKRYRANLINGLSGFKSANLIGTKDHDGQENLSIVSSVVHVGSDPSVLGCIFRPNIVPRHTYENIMATEYFTINHIHKDFYQQAHQTSARYPKNVSEFEAVGLTPDYRGGILAPFVLESQVKIGLKLVETYDIKCNPTHFVIGEIVFIELAESALDDEGRLLIHQIDTVAISGLDQYHDADILGQLPYAKPDSK